MNRIKELEAIRPELELFVDDVARKMGQSTFCLNIFTEDYKKGIDSLLQFAVAIMMDKPIFLLAPQGVKIPENVKKVAIAIEFYEPNDKEYMKAAAMKLVTAATRKDFAA